MLQAYSNIPMLRSIVDIIAGNVAKNTWRAFRLPRSASSLIGKRRHVLNTLRGSGPESAILRRHQLRKLIDTGEMEEVDHPILMLLDRPHPNISGMQFRQVTQSMIDLTGESFTISDRRAGGADTPPLELVPIPPDWAKKLPEPGKPVYEFRGPGWQPPPIPAEQVVWWKILDPANPFGRGSGIGGTLNNELDADEYAAQTIAYRFWNNATPELLISITGAKPEVVRALREQMMQSNRGFKRVAVPHVTNLDMKVEQLDQSFVDLDLVNLRVFLRDVIRETYGIPPEILGNVTNSNRATISTAQFLFSINVLTPRLDFMEDILNSQLVPMFGTDSMDIVLTYDSPVPTDRQFVKDMMSSNPEAFSIDERRALAEIELLDNDYGVAHPLPFSVTLTNPEDYEADDEAPEPAPIPSDDEPATDEEDEPEEPEEPEEPDSEERAASSRVRRLRAELKSRRKINAVKNAVKDGPIVTRHTQLWTTESAAWAELFLGRTGLDVDMGTMNDIIAQDIRNFGATRVKTINAFTKKRIAKEVSRGMAAQETQAEIAARIKGVFRVASDSRALTIARTEVNRSANWTAWRAMQNGGVTARQWVTQRDDQVRDEHAALDGAIIGIDEGFDVGGFSAFFPGDTGEPGQDINCRCTSIPVTVQEGRNIKSVDASEFWKAFDRRSLAWEKEARKAYERAFDEQEKAVLKKVRELF